MIRERAKSSQVVPNETEMNFFPPFWMRKVAPKQNQFDFDRSNVARYQNEKTCKLTRKLFLSIARSFNYLVSKIRWKDSTISIESNRPKWLSQFRSIAKFLILAAFNYWEIYSHMSMWRIHSNYPKVQFWKSIYCWNLLTNMLKRFSYTFKPLLSTFPFQRALHAIFLFIYLFTLRKALMKTFYVTHIWYTKIWEKSRLIFFNLHSHLRFNGIFLWNLK